MTHWFSPSDVRRRLRRASQNNPDSLAVRLIANIAVGEPDACWPFTGCLTKNGYGKIADGKGAWTLAHRAAFTVFIGPVPEGLKVLHHCDNRPCCNPSHLYAGTSADNAQDREIRNRGNHARGERINTARLTTEQVAAIRTAIASDATLAALFGVHRSTIGRIRSGKSWVGDDSQEAL